MMRGALEPTVIDLFAGAGGLSSSLEAVGWQSLAVVDNDPAAVDTLRANQARGHLKNARIVQADIRDVAAADLCPDDTRLDLLAGGPPCQPFSSAGRLQAFDDPRGNLFREFVRLAEELKPRFLLFENVAGLVTAKTPDGEVGGVLRCIQGEFERIGYFCRFDLLNAADFGSPQRRVRLYMLASRDEAVPEFPYPTHSRQPALEMKPWVTLGDFLKTQPAPNPHDIARPSAARAAELLALKPGTGLRSGGIVEANRPSGHWGYRQDCFVADQSSPSRTIRAATTPDWIRMEDGGLRRLTWRECAGLQGFPSDWEISGNVASRFRQIGNAVQGHVGRALGRKLLDCAETLRNDLPASALWPKCFHKRVRYTTMEELTNGAVRRAARERNNALSSTLV